MNLTRNEIKGIIEIARQNLDLDSDDIIKSIIDGYVHKEGIPGFIDRLKYLISYLRGKPILERPTTADIIQVCSKIHKCPEKLIRKKTRKREIIRIRQQYYLIASLFHYSESSSSFELNQDHATAHFHKYRAIDYCKMEKDYYKEIINIINLFKNHKSVLFERLNEQLK